VHRRNLGIALAVAGLTLALFWPVRTFEFLNYDDPQYVLRNDMVRQGLGGDGLRWAFTTTAVSNWHPLTWISHMTDVQLFGLDAGLHHLSSLILHAAAAVLMYLALLAMTGMPWHSGAAAALFALHPLHVESVAWVAERKDLLSGVFWWASLAAYAGYASRPGAVRYLLTFLLFTAGLMAKPMVVTLPAVMLLLDFWPLRRFTAGRPMMLLAEKIPFFLAALLSAAVTWSAQQGAGSMRTLAAYPLDVRIGNALHTCVLYLAKTFFPVSLAVFYPHPGALPLWKTSLAALFLVFISLAALRSAKSRPWFLTGWAWFLVTLLPVIGIVQVGWQGMADRYTYIPLAGIFIALVWGTAEFLPSRQAGRSAAFLALAVIIPLAFTARRQLGHWQSSTALFEHALAVTDGNFVAHHNLAAALAASGRGNEAEPHYREVLRLRPDYEKAYVSLGALLAGQERYAEAEGLFREALARVPDFAEAHYNLAVVLIRTARYESALDHLERAAAARRDHWDTLNNLGALYLALNRTEEAEPPLRRSVQLRPESLAARRNLAALHTLSGRHALAVEEYEFILLREPDSAVDHRKLAEALSRMGRDEEAEDHFDKARGGGEEEVR